MIFFILSFALYVVKNTPAKLELVKIKLRDRVRVYRQHIRQPEYEKLKVEEHLRMCSKGTFKIFLLLQMRGSEIELRKKLYEKIQNKII